ncbi:MAG: selenide, water dikinase SelD [Bacteroidota bacterium]|nr:selenide, water dikinase SelD [Bacteroidota bacterium]
MDFDLLSTVENGGCSAKLSPKQLEGILAKLPRVTHENLMVGIDTHDDAGVYRLNEDTALIYTTDFFPPVCSNPYEFGQIAAANALSDVYAMGGKPLLALNLMMFPSKQLPMEAYTDILRGGFNKVEEAEALLVGGHTIEDTPPKYGLAVVGVVHPDKLITNAGVKPGDVLILTKPLGTGVILAGQRNKLTDETSVQTVLNSMKLLNKTGAEIMQKYEVKGATDITGFGLLGHSMRMAQASNVSFHLISKSLPLFPEVYSLLDDGCIPGAAFRNLEFVNDQLSFSKNVNYNMKMLACDAQTSGGLLMAVAAENAYEVLSALHDSGVHPDAAIIGDAVPRSAKSIYFD